MGTPRFAVPSLEILIRNEYPVKAVITATGKPAGRGLLPKEPAVKVAAMAHGIPVMQPADLRDDDFAAHLWDIAADLFVVVAFRMLPEKIWRIPRMGSINLHASLLPLYRGAAPINHAIINGESVTGVTTFMIDKEIDKGNILLQEETPIAENETAGSLHDRLMTLGAELLLRTVEEMAEGGLMPKPQSQIAAGRDLPAAPKISNRDCRINWSMPADRVYDFVRGLSPRPAAWTILVSGNKRLIMKIFETDKIPGTHSHTPGKVIDPGEKLVIAAGDGFIELKKILPEGRKPMSCSDFLRGFRLDPGAFMEQDPFL